MSDQNMEENTSRAVPVSRIAQIIEFCELEIVNYEDDVWTVKDGEGSQLTLFLTYPESELDAMKHIAMDIHDPSREDQSRSYEIITRLIELTKKRESC